ncbi:hypothetical protein [Algoriphagus namhaensis]
MRKIILTLGLVAVSFAAFPCGTTWNACGAQDIADMIEDISLNCGEGTITTIVDICSTPNHVVIVEMGFAGPNSSGG